MRQGREWECIFQLFCPLSGMEACFERRGSPFIFNVCLNHWETAHQHSRFFSCRLCSAASWACGCSMEGGPLWVSNGLAPAEHPGIRVGNSDLHRGNSASQGGIRPRFRPWSVLSGTLGLMFRLTSHGTRQVAKITGACDPQLTTGHQSGCKQKPSVAQATVGDRLPWACLKGMGGHGGETTSIW